MQRSIWKYQLAPTGINRIEMPGNACILSVQMQGNIPTIWALVDQDEDMQTKTLRVFGTGHTIPLHCGRYVGTFQMGSLVWHLFDESYPGGV